MTDRSPTTEAGRRLLAEHDGPWVPQAILAIEDEARRPYHDPQDRWRLVKVASDFLEAFGTRTNDGQALRASWGEPDADGIYEPIFTRTGSTEAERLDEARAPLVAALERIETAPTTDIVTLNGETLFDRGEGLREAPQTLVDVFHRAYCARGSVIGPAHSMPPCGERADAFWSSLAATPPAPALARVMLLEDVAIQREDGTRDALLSDAIVYIDTYAALAPERQETPT